MVRSRTRASRCGSSHHARSHLVERIPTISTRDCVPGYQNPEDCTWLKDTTIQNPTESGETLSIKLSAKTKSQSGLSLRVGVMSARPSMPSTVILICRLSPSPHRKNGEQ